MINSIDIVKYYTYFYNKIYSINKNKLGEKDNKIIQNFLKKLDNKYKLISIGNNFLWEYFLYQFRYWDALNINSFNKKIQLSFIIGDKAFDRWSLYQSGEFQNNNFTELIGKYQLKKEELRNDLNRSYNSNNEIQIKERFYNTQNGFDLCLTMTTLYNENHKCCIECKFKEDCKMILKDTYPKIYEQRFK